MRSFLLACALVAACMLAACFGDRTPTIEVVIEGPGLYRVDGSVQTVKAADLDAVLHRGIESIRASADRPPDGWKAGAPELIVAVSARRPAACTAGDLFVPIITCVSRKVRNVRVEGADMQLPETMNLFGGYSFLDAPVTIAAVRAEDDMEMLEHALQKVQRGRKLLVAVGRNVNYIVTVRALGKLLEQGRKFDPVLATDQNVIEFRLPHAKTGKLPPARS